MKYLFFFALYISHSGFSQSWEVKRSFPALGRDDGIAFSLNSYGYCVTGNTGNFSQSNLMYKYDALTDSWEQKASFPGIARQYSTVITINNKAYLVGGYSKKGKGLSEVWCYDALEDTRNQKANFPGGLRWGAFSFAISGHGYFGCGTDIDTVYSDFWEYNPSSDIWVQLNDFSGGARREAVGCAVSGIGMAGLGFKTFTVDGFYKDWYLFDPKTKLWGKSADYPGGFTAYAKAETNGNNAVVGSGMDQNQIFTSSFYQYSVKKGAWTKLPNLTFGPVRGCSSFSINKTVYLTTGLTSDYIRSNFLLALNFTTTDFEVDLFPNPTKGCFHLSSNFGSTELTIHVYNISGKLITEENATNNFIDYSQLPPGLYFLKISANSNNKLTKRLIIY